jgi:HlyD family secretion protein
MKETGFTVSLLSVLALVQDTFYSEGEWVAAGNPVVSLPPPGNLKLRFFVPETAVGSLKID